jgi:hypothetical protein
MRKQPAPRAKYPQQDRFDKSDIYKLSSRTPTADSVPEGILASSVFTDSQGATAWPHVDVPGWCSLGLSDKFIDQLVECGAAR